MSRKCRKAQVTAFIIIAIILILASATVYYITSIKERLGTEIIVPQEVVPVYNYITSCISQIGEDAIDLIGWQGGYLYLPPKISKNPNSYIAADPFGIIITPLWYYQGEDRVPPLSKIEQDISQYVLENIRACVGDYGALKDRFDIIELENMSARTVIAKDDVVIELVAPMNIVTKHEEAETRVDRFMSVIPVRLKRMWDLASKTMSKENSANFMENLTIDFLSMNPNIPMDGLLLKCGVDSWRLSEIKKELQDMLYYNLPRMRIEDTNYAPFARSRSYYEDLKDYGETITEQMESDTNNKIDVLSQFSIDDAPPDTYEYGKLLIDVDAVDAKDLKANFIYRPDWGLYVMAHPNDNGVLRSNMVEGPRQYLSFLCINSYHFTYDVYYPMMVSIRDDESFNGKGYVFRFAFPVVVINNDEGRDRASSLIFEDIVTDTGFCTSIGTEKADIRAYGIYAGYTDMELDGVNITYQCINKFCELGQTKADEGVFRLRARMPRSCINPIIIAEKEGYLKTKGQLMGTRLDLQMTKVKQMKFKIFKHRYESSTQALSESGIVLSPEDEATVILTMHIPGQAPYEQYAVSGQDESITLAEDDMRYDVEIFVNQFGKLIGGYSAKNISISYSDVVDNDEIIFNVFDYYPLAQTDEQQMDLMTYYTGRSYAEQLKPIFRQVR
jgi:hypothetical protein